VYFNLPKQNTENELECFHFSEVDSY